MKGETGSACFTPTRNSTTSQSGTTGFVSGLPAGTQVITTRLINPPEKTIVQVRGAEPVSEAPTEPVEAHVEPQENAS